MIAEPSSSCKYKPVTNTSCCTSVCALESRMQTWPLSLPAMLPPKCYLTVIPGRNTPYLHLCSSILPSRFGCKPAGSDRGRCQPQRCPGFPGLTKAWCLCRTVRSAVHPHLPGLEQEELNWSLFTLSLTLQISVSFLSVMLLLPCTRKVHSLDQLS